MVNIMQMLLSATTLVMTTGIVQLRVTIIVANLLVAFTCSKSLFLVR